MKELLSQIHFASPLSLFLLLLLPLLWLRLRAATLPVILWRSLIFLLLVLALADLEMVSQVTKAGERIFAFDLSRSIPEAMRRWMTQQNFLPGPGDRVFVFGGEVQEVSDWNRWLRGEVSNNPIKPEATNLEKLVSTLAALPAAPRSLFLFTDGWQTQGAVESLLPSLGPSGLRIFPMLPTSRLAVANVAVKKLLVPQEGTKGESVNLKVVIENQNSKEVDGILSVARDGKRLKEEQIRIKPGTQVFPYQASLSEGPLISFSASFAARSPSSDLFSIDNQATSWIAVQSKEKILLLNGHSGEGRYLEEILKRRGYEVTSIALSASSGSPPPPAGYGVVIFNNVEREKFSTAYLSEIERHVAAGNALVMLGAEASFGPGGYRQSPIETTLPVELRDPKKEEKNRAVVLVIDKSGSMREENKLLYAKEAAKAVVGQLKDGDLVGVVGFDIEPFVITPLTTVERLRGNFDSQIDRLKAGGRTYLYPAIIEAKRQLERQSAGRKHVIILSDGETGGSASDYIDLVTVMKSELKITVSSVAIGAEANVPLMKRIAQYGGGLFHHTFDPTTLPQIVLQQLQDKPDEGPLVERDFVPLSVRGSELLADFPERSYPRLKGYIETEIKRGAHLDLVIPRDATRAPLLASWHYGKGKAVVFTTDLQGRWTQEWIEWPLLERFWGRVFDWLRPLKESLPPHEVRINLQRERPVLDLYLYGDGSSVSGFRYSFSGRDSSGEGVLRKMAPGHYQTDLAIAKPGDYRIILTEERSGGSVSYPVLGYTLPFDPAKAEVTHEEFNIELLEQLAKATGGEVNPPGTQRISTKETVRVPRSLRPELITLAMILFLCEIIFRRFSSYLGAIWR